MWRHILSFQTQGTRYGMSSKSDIDIIVPGGKRDVLHAAAAIFVVLARHLGLRGSLNGQTQPSSPCTSAGIKLGACHYRKAQICGTHSISVQSLFRSNKIKIPFSVPLLMRMSCQYLVSTVNRLGLLTSPSSNPGPYARTRVGSQPSVTITLKGLLGTAMSSYRISIRCMPTEAITSSTGLNMSPGAKACYRPYQSPSGLSQSEDFCFFTKEQKVKERVTASGPMAPAIHRLSLDQYSFSQSSAGAHYSAGIICTPALGSCQ